MENRPKYAASFRKRLRAWYKTHSRKLPWREIHDSYKIWISEVMLQQTTVQAVLPYYREWIKLFPDVKSLSQATLQKVLKAWQGLGYYQRAKNLHRASKIITDKFGGKIPQNYEEMRKLPGFGPYTTAAVLSFAFNKSYPALDANVRRVLMRQLGERYKLNPANDKALFEFFKFYFPPKETSFFNQALMELGALVCRPKNPLCFLCPISQFCQAYEEGKQEVIPRPKNRNYRKIEAVVAIIRKNRKYLIQKRPSKGLLADLWEFPGGKRKEGEKLEEALHREIKEELSSEVKDERFLTRVHHAYTQFQVTLYAYECSLKNETQLNKGRHRWVTLKALRSYPVPSGSAKIVKFLEEREKIR
ncbi:MAG: A/G-specific adenine glycosylase [Candidatus Aminicenantes bacterium]|nr:A/G-specific adenine glycosylase [Candidatus Aminicenantes bacterium]